MEKPVPVIRLDNVSKVYDGSTPFLALDRISLSIRQGEFIAIVGPSGSGKSTLLHILGCLDRPSKGEVYIDGIPISGMSDDEISVIRRDTIGFVFQAFNLAPTLNVFKNVELALMISGKEKQKRAQIVEKYLAQVGLSGKKYNYPSQISGGEKQRVAIARALANEPKIILADEPTGNLDSKSSEEILGYIESLWKKLGVTVIIVTHDMNVASRANRIIRIKDGKIESDFANKRRG
jgi:putative ABC transport system ATP-binding protein